VWNQSSTGKLLAAIEKECGSFATFQEHFTAKGMGRFGSGWAWLVKNADGSVTLSDTPNQDTPLLEGKTPIWDWMSGNTHII